MFLKAYTKNCTKLIIQGETLITDSQKNYGWKGCLEIIWSDPYAQLNLSWTVLKKLLKITKEGDSTTSPKHLGILDISILGVCIPRTDFLLHGRFIFTYL